MTFPTTGTPGTTAPDAPPATGARTATFAAAVAAQGSDAPVHPAGSPTYDGARLPWNVAVDQRPAAVAEPRTPDDVVAIVRAARASGLRVAAQGTGHNAGPLAEQDLSGVVLVRTGALDGVTIDPARRVARVGAGAVWESVVEAASRYGLAVLHGSSPDVGVVGYTLGGGMFVYSRALGLACNSMVAAELVLADGSAVRASADENAELFWALRGGGGSFGIVTALELELFELPTVQAGMMLWDGSRADEVLRAWAAWAPGAPDEITTSLRLLNLPPLPDLPPFLRGRKVVAVDGAVLDSDERAAELLAPLRVLEPELDTFGRVPASAVVRLHMDPEGPTPSVSESMLVDELPGEALDALLDAAGPESGTSLLAAEVRQLGGAVSRPVADGGALTHLDGDFLVFGVAVAPTPEAAAQGRVDAVRLVDALRPWSRGRSYLNFSEVATAADAAYDDGTLVRLAAVRDAVDPERRIVANHPVGERRAA
ncbi:FAD-binding oxidoreductase [Luteimicrobium sp. NPDC057192]|uniref:FAD-binding oxidoreductase n=1 Tax=Luteimicrobium sp. NPDC057192 TaxID=3346042 RepID=UPI00363A4920